MKGFKLSWNTLTEVNEIRANILCSVKMAALGGQEVITKE